METNTAKGDCPRRTLNEVLLAELGCLRPELLAELRGNPDTKACLPPATYADSDERQAANLREIYTQIGSSTRRRREGQAKHLPLSALCLSGGGIRSATFNLGVLQALARIGLLDKFDYLSSVSGGGYIAAWLRAWMHRRSVTAVINELGGRLKGPNPLATEPKPVTNLRDYSNYLTPKVGLFSGDTWSAAATIARNLLLNWLVLVPLLGAVIGVPLLFVLVIRTSDLPNFLPVCLLALAVLIEIVASVMVYRARRFAKKPGTPQSYFVLHCVVPICLAAGTLSAAGIGLDLPWARPDGIATRADLIALWTFALIWSVAVPLLGWGIAEVIAHVAPAGQTQPAGEDTDAEPGGRQARQVSAGIEIAALVISGVVGAALLVGVVTWWFADLYNHPALYAILVLPSLLGMYLLSRVVFIGIASLNDEQGDRIARGTGPSADSQLRSRISSNDSDREWWSRLSGWVLLVIVSWLAVTGICLIGCYLPNVIWGLFRITRENHDVVTYAVKGTVSVLGLVSGAIAALTASSSQTPSSSDAPAKQTPPAVTRILAIAGPLFVVCLIMALSWGVKGLAEIIIGPPDLFRLHFNRAGSAQPVPLRVTLEFGALLLGLVVVALAAGRIANVNRFSLHGMYRNRLVRAYLGASNCEIHGNPQRMPDPFTGFALDDNFPLHQLCSPPRSRGLTARAGSPDRGSAAPDRALAHREFDIERPLSIINTTLNLVNGENLAWQQRKAESFSMTPLFCGSRLEGYRDSREYGGPGGITVGTAVTISGAAANPNMGYSTSPVLGFLMAIFNVRLGAWLGNTNRHGDRTFSHPGPRHSLAPLFAEMFGLTDSTREYVNLSDGGHFDNLGLYEVVMRRCRHVLVSDAGQDGSFSFEDLGNSIRKIRVDFGINIVFDRIQILPNTPEKDGLCCAIGRIRYSDVDDVTCDEDGLLIYIKPTLRGRGAQIPYDIYSYSRGSADFPHESTADQWFSESQFESYRALGSHIVEQLTEPLKTRANADFDAFHRSVEIYISGAAHAGSVSTGAAGAAALAGAVTSASVAAVTAGGVATLDEARHRSLDRVS